MKTRMFFVTFVLALWASLGTAMDATINTYMVESQPFNFKFSIRRQANEALSLDGFYLNWGNSQVLDGNTLLQLVQAGGAQVTPNPDATVFEITIPNLVFPAGEHTFTTGFSGGASHSSTFILITSSAMSQMTAEDAALAFDRYALLHTAVSTRAMAVASGNFTAVPYDTSVSMTAEQNKELNWWLIQLQATNAQAREALKVLSDEAAAQSRGSRQAAGDSSIAAGRNLYNFGKFLYDMYSHIKGELFGYSKTTTDPVLQQMQNLSDAQLDQLYETYSDGWHSFDLGSAKPNNEKYASGREWLSDLESGVHDQHFRTVKSYLITSMSESNTYTGNAQEDLGKHYQKTAVETGNYAFKISYEGLKKTPIVGDAIGAFEKAKGAVEDVEKLKQLVDYLKSQGIDIPTKMKQNLQALGISGIDTTAAGQTIGEGLDDTDKILNGNASSGDGAVQPSGQGGDDVNRVYVLNDNEKVSVIGTGNGDSVPVESGSNDIVLLNGNGEVSEDTGVTIYTGSTSTVTTSFPAAPALVASASDVTVGFGETVTLSGYATGGTAPYEYGWYYGGSQVATGASITLPASTFAAVGTYTVMFAVLDANRTVATDELTITVTPGSMSTPSVSVGNDKTISAGDAVSITANTSGGSGPYSYAWTLNGTAIGQSASLSIPGSYTTTPGTYSVYLTVTDTATGLTGTDSMLLTIQAAASLSVNAGSDRTVNAGTSVTLSASATGGSGSYSYAWSTGSLSLGSGASLTLPSTIPAGSYTITVAVTDASTGATGSDSLSLTVEAPTSTLTMSLSSDKTVAYTESIRIAPSYYNGSGNYTYSWTANGIVVSTASSYTITNDGSIPAGTYTIALAMTDTATGVVATDSMQVTLTSGGTTPPPSTGGLSVPISVSVSINTAGYVLALQAVGSSSQVLDYAAYGMSTPSWVTISGAGTMRINSWPSGATALVGTIVGGSNDGLPSAQGTLSDASGTRVSIPYRTVSPTNAMGMILFMIDANGNVTTEF